MRNLIKIWEHRIVAKYANQMSVPIKEIERRAKNLGMGYIQDFGTCPKCATGLRDVAGDICGCINCHKGVLRI